MLSSTGRTALRRCRSNCSIYSPSENRRTPVLGRPPNVPGIEISAGVLLQFFPIWSSNICKILVLKLTTRNPQNVAKISLLLVRAKSKQEIRSACNGCSATCRKQLTLVFLHQLFTDSTTI